MWDEQHRRDLCRRMPDHCRENGIALTYPPATNEQVWLAEEQLGFPLPTFLRMLYTEVVNGGPELGTCYGLFGCIGGYAFGDSGYAAVPRTVEHLVSKGDWRPHSCIFEALARHPGRMIQCNDIPDGFMTISDEGCGLSLGLDINTERRYLTGCGSELRPEDPRDPSSYLVTLEYVSPSLEDWLEQWLDGTAYSSMIPKVSGLPDA
jgi:hypothetical protein